MLRRIRFVLACTWLAVAGYMPLMLGGAAEGRKIDLSGTWAFRADPNDEGIEERWFTTPLDGSIRLPGSMAENGKGNDVSVETRWTGDILDKSWFTEEKYEKYRQPGNVKVPFWLNPVNHYVGPAWYQRDVAIPESWGNRRVVLFLERCHWETRLWVDGKEAGIRTSLGAPHDYDLSSLLGPGRHRLTIRVDNRIKEIDVGQNAHSISDHTQTNWNGIVGVMELRATPPVFIDDVRIYPNAAAKTARVEITIINKTKNLERGQMTLTAESFNSQKKHSVGAQPIEFSAPPGELKKTLTLDFRKEALLWDEFDPALYNLRVRIESGSLKTPEEKMTPFGLRDIKAQATRIAVNGRPVFLRGTLECAIFPKTGYPAMDVAEWKRIFGVCRAHGLNHIRFHSWCPPEAAFQAADEMGIYLYVECGGWCTVGNGTPFDKWLFEESERIVKAYGNHPSFCLMSYGNEPAGENQAKFLGEFVNHWKSKDSRRLYTSASGWPVLPESDFQSTYEPRLQLWGAGLDSIINKEPPRTDFDFRGIIRKYDKPVISHEIGQWCVYPDFKEIPAYTGVLKAANFEIFKDTLAESGMGDLAEKFLMASGKLQTLCYKAEIEAALRTPGFAGFELLDLHDFPGQGTALVGVLNAFWGEKGYVSPAEFSRFCNATVPLARMKKRIFLNGETFAADIEAAHFGKAPLKDVRLEWAIRNERGEVKAAGKLEARTIEFGTAIPIGRIEWPLAEVSGAAKFIFEVRIGPYSNDWDFWVYPGRLPEIETGSIMLAKSFAPNIRRHLEEGGKVLLTLEKGSLRPEKGGDIAVGFSSIFWNTAWTSSQPPHTLGVLCDPGHPALADFPTESHSNWQWWDAMSHAQAVVLDGLNPELQPVVRVIDDWFKNRPLGLIFEATVGPGKILISGIDLVNDLDRRPEARQLRYSLLKYMSGKDFAPTIQLLPGEITGLFKQ